MTGVAVDGAPDTAAPAQRPGRRAAADLARAAAVPVLAAALLLGLLCAWVTSGGLGTVARVRLQITGAVVPAPATADATSAYLTIRNTGAEPDELLSVSTAVSRQTMLSDNRAAPGAAAGTMVRVPGIAVPAHGSVTLGPYTEDIMLTQPSKLTVGQTVTLVLDFRVLGQVTVQAKVVPPGTP